MRHALGRLIHWWRGHQALVGVVSLSAIHVAGIAAVVWLRWGA